MSISDAEFQKQKLDAMAVCFGNLLLQVVPDSLMSPTFVLQKVSFFSIQYLCSYLFNGKKLSVLLVLGLTS